MKEERGIQKLLLCVWLISNPGPSDLPQYHQVFLTTDLYMSLHRLLLVAPAPPVLFQTIEHSVAKSDGHSVI